MSVIPTPAATVVLMDDMARVYMTKRPETMKFLGGYFVFPGGAVEQTDKLIDDEYIRNLTSDETFHYSYYVAAVRELYEEVGILLCNKSDNSFLQVQKEKEQENRRLLMTGELTFLQFLKQEELYLDLTDLTYFGNLITPEISPIRFDTRFFLARLPEGQEPNPDIYEIDEALWISPKEALSANKKGIMPMVLPTIATLHAINNYLLGNPLKMPNILNGRF